MGTFGDGPVGDADERADGTTLSFDAALFVLDPDETRRRRLDEALPDRIPRRLFEAPRTFDSAVSGNVAVAAIALSIPPERVAISVERTLSVSPHAHVVLLADEEGEVPESEIPRDRIATPPVDREMAELLVRMYLRSYYSAALERFYTLNIASNELERRAERGDGAAADRLASVEEVRSRVKAYLEDIRPYLEPEDLYELSDRGESVRSAATSPDQGSDPSIWGLPAACPNCDLDWTVYHGPNRGNGYERIGANTWRCANCSHVIANPDPSDRHVF